MNFIRKTGSLNGLLLGLFAIFGAFLLEGGSFSALFLLPPLLIVFGGTFATAIIGFGIERFLNIFSLIKLAYYPKEYNLTDLVYQFVGYSVKSRKEGLLTLEKEIKELEYGFPKKLMTFVLDGTDPETIQNVAVSEMRAMQDRHFSNIFIFTKMGGYSPTMGILGTVMALIMTLANAGKDPNIMIHNIASAFIATLWGVLSANLFWLPIGDKLKQCHLEEKIMMEMSLEGVLALQSGEIPSVVKARLASLLPPKEQRKILE
jgi:chemotaxis protein MotA